MTRSSGSAAPERLLGVAGLTEDVSVIDVGLGMDPALAGQGYGVTFGRAVLDFIAAEYPERNVRAVVQAWNERSLRMTRRLGFVDAGDLVSAHATGRVRYRIVVKAL